MAALKIFADVVSINQSLIVVDLLHNKIGSAGGNVLLDSIKGNSRITEFKVDSEMDVELYNALFKMSVKQNDQKKKGSKK